MKRATLLVCSFALMVAVYGQDRKQSQWDAYQPRTLASVIEECECDDESGDPSIRTYINLPGDFPSLVKVVYLGKSRPLPANKRELLTHWAKSRHPEDPQRIVELFRTEFLFREGKAEHWVAIQSPLLKPLPKEVKPGQSLH